MNTVKYLKINRLHYIQIIFSLEADHLTFEREGGGWLENFAKIFCTTLKHEEQVLLDKLNIMDHSSTGKNVCFGYQHRPQVTCTRWVWPTFEFLNLLIHRD